MGIKKPRKIGVVDHWDVSIVNFCVFQHTLMQREVCALKRAAAGLVLLIRTCYTPIPILITNILRKKNMHKYES
jgi:hypothetical protein